jgi:hypothetical protein
MAAAKAKSRKPIQAYPREKMTPELKPWHESPPAEGEVLAEIGRTLLALQPTELLFNRIAKALLPDEPLTLEGLAVLAAQ